MQPARRTRRLFDHPLTCSFDSRSVEVLRQSVADLAHPDELRELGLGIFLDRPLSSGKVPGEPDATPLVAGLAFSRSIAVQRINALTREELFGGQKAALDGALELLLRSPPRGLPLDQIGGASRPGSVSLVDARLASADFEYLRSVARGPGELFRLFDGSPLKSHERMLSAAASDHWLLTRAPTGAELLVYDARLRPRLELAVSTEQAFVCRGGVEYPAGGLLVTRLWEETADGSLREHDLRAEPIRLLPRER